MPSLTIFTAILLQRPTNKKLHCADRTTEISLCSLPPDCLRLILINVDYVCEKQIAWSLSGTCRGIRQALKECPAAVKLQGKWTNRQLLGAKLSPSATHAVGTPLFQPEFLFDPMQIQRRAMAHYGIPVVWNMSPSLCNKHSPA